MAFNGLYSSLGHAVLRGLDSLVAYSSLITACASATAWRQALGLLEAVGRPDVILLNTAISACESASAWRQASQLLRSLKCYGLQPTWPGRS